jgi:hypothetical protein
MAVNICCQKSLRFAYTSFKWANLASNNAGVTVVIIGLADQSIKNKKIFQEGTGGQISVRDCENINAYLLAGQNIEVVKSKRPISCISAMTLGNVPYDGGNLLIDSCDLDKLRLNQYQRNKFVKRFYGSAEFIRGIDRYCLWIEDSDLEEALRIPTIAERINDVRQMRLASTDAGTNALAAKPHQMREMNIGQVQTIVVPRVSSENRPYLPVGLADRNTVVGDKNYAIYDGPLWNMVLIASRLH